MRFFIMKWRWWYGTLPLLAALAGCGTYGGPAQPDEEHSGDGEAHVTVRAEPARLGSLRETVEGMGRCEALPNQIATLTPAVEGHVHELLVAQGKVVKKGQPIVELDKAVAQADLAEKTATRDGLRASLALLKSLPRLEEQQPNKLAIEQAKVAVAQAKATVDQLRPLRDRHEVADQQFFVAEKALEQASIQQQTAEAQLRMMLIGPRPEAIAEAEGKIKTADALVAFSRAHLDYHTIHAPIDGVLESLNCHPGQTIAIGTPIGEVVDTRQVFASVWLPARSALSLRVGQAALVRHSDTSVPLPDSSDAGEQGMGGKVAFVGRVADLQTGNLPIRILVDNPKGRLTIGQSIRVSIIVDERKGVLQVPVAAVLDLGEGPVLGIVRDGKSVVLHPEVRTPHQGWIEISGTDLKEGELVIVDGGYNLPEKTPVKVSDEKAEAKEEAKTEEETKAEAKEEAKTKEETKAEAKEKAK
jgi:multidrug efflux pump subunit AcrA (membrane-fusion protein)